MLDLNNENRNNMAWLEAIIKVLQENGEPMHYTEIAAAISGQQLRVDLGATPATTVNTYISTSINNNAENSPFIRVERGRYALRPNGNAAAQNQFLEQGQLLEEQIQRLEEQAQPAIEQSDETGLINAFGMYWSRENILWNTNPKILGQQQPGSKAVDFCNQKGVYLLYDGRTVVYVGRTTDQPLGVRLRQHINDRLNSRWDRFSWFGVFPIDNNGELALQNNPRYDLTSLIVTMEALLIEGLEPPQNRKRGDDFRAVEFLQVEDPEIQKTQIINLMDELKKKL